MKKPYLYLLAGFMLASCATPLYRLQTSFRSISRNVVPSIVQVNVVEISTQQMPREGNGPWDFFFPDPESPERTEKQFRMQGLGSGVILARSGNRYYVLTNNHVIGDGEEISITLHDKRNFPASLVGKDTRRDVALVYFESDDPSIQVATIGDSEALQVGDWVVAIGHPYGLDSSVTAGIVSGLHRSGPTDISDFIQTDASINQGNSGGALVNLRGEVVGINTWIQTPTGGSIGLGFAIPINSAYKAVKDFIAFGEVRYGWLGVTLTNPGAAVLEEYGYPLSGGAFITNVYRNSPGYVQGLLPGDLVVRINGKAVKNVDHMIFMLGELSIEEAVNVEVHRNSGLHSFDIMLGLRMPDTEIRKMYEDVWPGFTVYPLDAEILRQLSVAETVTGVLVISVDDRAIADAAGLKNGDIIYRVKGEDVATVGEFYTLINQESVILVLDVLREGAMVSINLEKKAAAE